MRMDVDQSWIDAEILRELSALSDDTENADFYTENDDLSTENVDDASEVSDDFTDSTDMKHIELLLDDYQKLSNNVVDTIKNQLEDVENLLNEQNITKLAPNSAFDEDVEKEAKSRGLDVDSFSKQILLELDKEDAKDETSNEQSQSESESGDSKFTLSAETGAIVEFFEADEIERKFRQQLHDWNIRQKQKDNSQIVENETLSNAIKERLKTLEIQRTNLMDAMKQEQVTLQQMKTIRDAEIDLESSAAKEALKSDRLKFEENVQRLESEKKSQEQFVNDLQTQARSQTESKRREAATKIQAVWRGHVTRSEYGETVQEWIQHGRQKRLEQRLREIENERIRLETQQKKIQEEEDKRLRQLEAERLKQEEAKRQEERERLRKLEEEKIEAEKARRREEDKKVEEEKKRKAEERRKEELRRVEEQKQKEDEKLRKEEEMRKEEERRKMEEEKRLAEENRRLEEEKRLEEERSKKEEEEKRLEEEKRKIEEEKRRKEEESRRLEEEKRQKEEEKRKEDEKRRKAEEKRLQEEKRRKEEEKRKEDEELEKYASQKFQQQFGQYDAKAKSSSSSNQITETDQLTPPEPEPEIVEISHNERLQQRRLEWMQTCTPFSKLLMEAKTKKCKPSTIPKRRPSSSKNLKPIPDILIFTDGLSDAYDDVIVLKLSKLPVYSLQPLGSCQNLTTLIIEKCQMVNLEVFAGCQNLRYVKCCSSKVEVVNFKNLQNLVYVDLSDNQISSIHGLDGCSNLKFLNLHKNRITGIDNLRHLSSLHTLILSKNSISRTSNIGDAPTIQSLNLSHNNIRKITELEKLSLLADLDVSFNSLDSLPILTNHVLLQNLNIQNNGLTDISALGLFWLPLVRNLNLRGNHISRLPSLDSMVSLQIVNLSDNNLSELKDFTTSLQNCEHLESLNVDSNPVVDLTPNLRDLVKTSLPWLRNICGFEIESKSCHKNHSSDFCQLCKSQLATKEKLESNYKTKLNDLTEDEHIHQIHSLYFEKSYKLSSDFRYAHEYGDIQMDKHDEDFFKFQIQTLLLREETVVPEKSSLDKKPNLATISQSNIMDARSKFEQALNPKTKSSEKSNDSLNQKTRISSKDLLKEKSAIKIQAFWRGNRCRKRIAMACDFAKMDHEFGNFDEIDMDNWGLDDDLLDQEWLPAESPTLNLTNSPVLGAIRHKPKEAWLSSKPPISPAPSSDLDTNRTKSEQLSEEWGFKDSKTAEMMMKRARKLKYDALKKKRLAKLDPQQRLGLLRKHENNEQLPTVRPPKAPQRKDYFKAKEEEMERLRLEKAAESQNKMHRMYEWLHMAPESSYQDGQKAAGLRRNDWAGSEGSLPRIEETSRSKFSPGSDFTSVSERASNRRFSHSDLTTQGRKLPPVKTHNSAPSAQRADVNMAWGGGKKRSTKRQS